MAFWVIFTHLIFISLTFLAQKYFSVLLTLCVQSLKLFRLQYVIILVIPSNFLSTVKVLKVFLIIINVIEKCWTKQVSIYFADLSPRLFYCNQCSYFLWYGTMFSLLWNAMRHIWHDLLLNNLCRLLAFLTFFPKWSYYYISYCPS